MGVPKKIFQPLGPQFGLKIRGRARAPRAPSLDAPLRSVIIFLKVTTALVFFSRLIFISARIELLKCLSI